MIDMKSEVFFLIYQRHFIIKQNGINGSLLNLIIDFLDARKQRVVLNCQYSSWTSRKNPVKTEVPQGYILSPHFFFLNPLSANPTKWSNTLKQFVSDLLTIFLSVFDHFVGLALKGLRIQ